MSHANVASKTPLLDLLRRSGEADLGASLLRLAQLAAAVHLHEAARVATGGEDLTQEGSGANGLAPGPRIAAMPVTGRGSAHTEVGR